ncbi:hypothetical protein GA0115242_118127 [Streptomyces sp. SolWspMP-5a-2]|nr:hypothetical protein GA0115242_118127 [Streptomyces sp. SolWspMP-5a-2]
MTGPGRHSTHGEMQPQHPFPVKFPIKAPREPARGHALPAASPNPAGAPSAP